MIPGMLDQFPGIIIEMYIQGCLIHLITFKSGPLRCGWTVSLTGCGVAETDDCPAPFRNIPVQ